LYTATIIDRTITEKLISIYDVQFNDGDDQIDLQYKFKYSDKNVFQIEETVEMEVNRLDGLVTAFATWKAKEGDEII